MIGIEIVVDEKHLGIHIKDTNKSFMNHGIAWYVDYNGISNSIWITKDYV